MAHRYLEDFAPGEETTIGEAVVSADEIRAFASHYDPQPFHLDEGAAAEKFGGLIASGWHTCALIMRLIVDNFIDGETSLGSPGLGPIRWLHPVRPGQRLRARITVRQARPSRSKPDRGTLVFDVEAIDEYDIPVMTIENWIGIVLRRPA
ncbi:MAG: MaoC family dehydratase [Candidatus Eremiobacteraeota bacterium]|nr:MaoC family dehydratase [Candidatus Eremiobacteraeota bacterium]